MAKCAFCGSQIHKGTGTLYVYTSGKQHWFCGSKCEKHLLKLKRKPLKVKWTDFYQKAKSKRK